jgi:hypothetical protein
MKKNILSATLVAATCAMTPAFAQQRVAAHEDWAVYTADSPKECWLVSNAAKVENTRGGKPAPSVKRGDILLYVTYLPGQKIVGEVSFGGGYPFKPGQAIKLQIGSATYDMVPEGEFAWPASSTIDTKIRVSMTKGSEAVVRAESARGTKTKDTFSLKGFTAALNDAKKRCGVS